MTANDVRETVRGTRHRIAQRPSLDSAELSLLCDAAEQGLTAQEALAQLEAWLDEMIAAGHGMCIATKAKLRELKGGSK